MKSLNKKKNEKRNGTKRRLTYLDSCMIIVRQQVVCHIYVHHTLYMCTVRKYELLSSFISSVNQIIMLIYHYVILLFVGYQLLTVQWPSIISSSFFPFYFTFVSLLILLMKFTKRLFFFFIPGTTYVHEGILQSIH